MKKSIKETFNNEAEMYDVCVDYLLPNYDEFLDEVVSKIEMPINSKFYLLDLGCGTGNLCKRIREKFPNAHIYALDFSEEMLNIAKMKDINNIRYINADMFSLEFLQLPYFDYIISSYVFHNFKTINEHSQMFKLINDHLSCNGTFILADLIFLNSISKRNKVRKQMKTAMKKNGLQNRDINSWFKILESEDFPLSIQQNIELLDQSGFTNVTSIYHNDYNSAIFTASKSINIIQLKAEILVCGLKPNELTKKIFYEQNPQAIWKTGNNGIFLSVNNVDLLTSINHTSNISSPFEILETENRIILYKYNREVNVDVNYLKFPHWFFNKVIELNNEPFSKFFVYEGKGFLHLAYKGCSFSENEKCKFCSTKRRDDFTDSSIDEICTAVSETIKYIPADVHICLGGGTYIPFGENTAYFKKIIRCIRKHNKEIPIWVEMIPPSLEEIDELIHEGATSFGFNIEIWNNELRKKICPGKSQVSKEHYVQASKYVKEQLGPNRVGSCLIVGIDSYKDTKEAIDFLVSEGIEPCLLPYKKYDDTDMVEYDAVEQYLFSFYKLSEYAAKICSENGVVFEHNQGCLKCSCCTIIHDFQQNIN